MCFNSTSTAYRKPSVSIRENLKVFFISTRPKPINICKNNTQKENLERPMKTFLIFTTALFFLTACTLFKKSNNEYDWGRYPAQANGGMCSPHPQIKPLFNVIENTPTQIVVELGHFAQQFGLSEDSYQYKVTFRGSKENKDDQEQLVLEGEGHGQTYSVQVPVTKTGVYYFTVFENEKNPMWKQKVFSIAPKERQLSEADKETLAAQYAPILSMHEQERYYPVSLEYLTNKAEPDAQLDQEPFRLVNKRIKDSVFSMFSSKPKLDLQFKFKDINRVLPYYGHSESVLKSDLPSGSSTALKRRFGENHKTVYYSVFENVRYKEIYINYHFFYTYDPKNGTENKDVAPAHIFDRESMTVVLRSTSRQPIMVFFGAHLASQTMGQLDRSGNILQRWETGRVFVNWPLVNKINGHPVPAIALGSHGVYPKTGNYAVLLNNIKLLLEPAGGKKLLYPETLTEFQKTENSHSYKLQNLKLESVTSNCKNTNNILAFSGSTVDVLGPVNASFPPYTDREEDYFSYADPNAPMFEMNLGD